MRLQADLDDELLRRDGGRTDSGHGGQRQGHLRIERRCGFGRRGGAGPSCHRKATDLRVHRQRPAASMNTRSEEHTSELQSLAYLVCRLLLEKKKNKNHTN